MRKKRNYQNEYPYLISTKTVKSVGVFKKEKFAKYLFDKVFYYQKKFEFEIYSFAILPDLFVLSIRTKEKDDISSIMRCIKYRTASDIRKFYCKPTLTRLDGKCKHDVPLINHYPKRGFHSIWEVSFVDEVINDITVFEEMILKIKNTWKHLDLNQRFSRSPFYYKNQNLISDIFLNKSTQFYNSVHNKSTQKSDS